jgi:predicted nucleic acid-binding protein
MPFIAVYDADVLYPNTLRDLLIRIAQLPHLVQAKWTEKILDEVTDNLRKNVPDITVEKTDRLRQLMNTAVRGCLVSGYEPLNAALDLPDPNDRHVLAAAIRAKAQIIVTKNLRDFPAERLAPWDLKAKSPDSFVRDQIDIDRQADWACLQQIVDSRTRHPVTIDDVLDELQRDGLVGSVTVLRMS